MGFSSIVVTPKRGLGFIQRKCNSDVRALQPSMSCPESRPGPLLRPRLFLFSTGTSLHGRLHRKEHQHRQHYDLANYVTNVAGRPFVFVVAALVVVVWALTGPIFDYSDTWQLVMNTGTTVITFLMVFLIQNSQNRDNSTDRRDVGFVSKAVRESFNRH